MLMLCLEHKYKFHWFSIHCRSDKENESGGEEQNGVSKETNDNAEHIESQEKSEDEEDETVSTAFVSSVVSVNVAIHFHVSLILVVGKGMTGN